jgi:hypothetical protein
LVAFGAADIYHGGVIDYAKEEAISRVLANVFGLNYLTLNKVAIVDYIASLLPDNVDLSLLDVEKLTLLATECF